MRIRAVKTTKTTRCFYAQAITDWYYMMDSKWGVMRLVAAFDTKAERDAWAGTKDGSMSERQAITAREARQSHYTFPGMNSTHWRLPHEAARIEEYRVDSSGRRCLDSDEDGGEKYVKPIDADVR
jgi:hypothetical protein